MSKRSQLRTAPAVALVAATILSGCATLPTSGNVRLSTLHGSGGGPAQGGVRVLPRPPGQGWTPIQIVRGFLAASASFDHKHGVAREYLTRAFAQRWRPGWAPTVIGTPNIGQEPGQRRPLPGSPQGTWINVTSPYVTKMTTAVRYASGNLVVSPGPIQYQFLVTDDHGHNRISAIDVNGKLTSTRLLLLTQPDFQRDYQTRNLYFFPVGSKYFRANSTTKMLIPDPVPIPLQATGVQEVRGLVRSLFKPPPVSSWLYGAVTTAFPDRVSMTVRIVGGIKAVIDLGGDAAKIGRARLSRIAAQLYATLTSSPYSASPATQIQSVVLEVNHQVVHQPLPPPYDSWIPRVGAAEASDKLYFMTVGEQPGPAIQAVTDGKPAPVSIPTALGGDRFDVIAASPAPANRQVLAGCTGHRVYLMPQWQGGTVTSRPLPAQCTSLSWDTHGNLWLSTGKGAFVIRAAGPGDQPGPTSQPGPVTRLCFQTCAPGPRSPTISMLRVAPDGVRVAMIVHSAAGSQVMFGAISTNPSYTYVGATKPVRVGSDIPDPGALTWLDPDHLLVLDHAGSATSQIYEVPLNGDPSSRVATPRRTQSLAASWPVAGRPPRVVVGVTSPQSEILSFNAGLFNPSWSRIVKGTSPILPG